MISPAVLILSFVFLLLPLAHARLFPMIPWYVAEVPLFLGVFSFLSSGSLFQRITLFLKKERWLLWSQGLFVFGATLSLLLSGNFLDGLGLLKSFIVFPLLFMVLLALLIRAEEDWKSVLLCWWGGLVGAAIAGLTLFTDGILTYDGRLASLYASPNYLAMLLSPGVLIGWWLLEDRWSRAQVFYGLGTAMLLLALILTRSYAVIFTTILLSIPPFALWTQRLQGNSKKMVLIVMGIALIGWWIALEGSTEKFQALFDFAGRSSSASRLMIWEAALKISQDNFPFGIGLGQFQTVYLAYQPYFPPYLEWAVPEPHNLFLSIFLSTGFLGLAGFIWGSVIVVGRLFPFLHHPGQFQQKTARLLLGFLGWFLLIGLVDTPFFRNDLALVWWGVLGLSLALVSSQDATD